MKERAELLGNSAVSHPELHNFVLILICGSERCRWKSGNLVYIAIDPIENNV